MSHATTASPKPSFRAPCRVGDAVVVRGIAGWTPLPMPELLTRASCRKDWMMISAEPPLSVRSTKHIFWKKNPNDSQDVLYSDSFIILLNRKIDAHRERSQLFTYPYFQMTTEIIEVDYQIFILFYPIIANEKKTKRSWNWLILKL